MDRRRHPVVVVAIAIAVVLAACSSGAGGPTTIGRDGSDTVVTPKAVAIGSPIDAYAITYRVEERDGDAVRVSTASLSVRRPFDSRFDTRSGSKTLTRRAAHFGYLATGGADAPPDVVVAAPGLAPGDVRTDLLLAGVRGREVRRVAGRLCQVHRVGAPLLTGVVVLLAPGDITADECVDADGLVLEEVVSSTAGGISSRWVATDVDTSPHITARDLRLADGLTVPPAEGGGTLQPVDPTTASLGTFWQLDTPPAGFKLKGRYAIVPPQKARTDDPNTRPQVVAGVSDVWVRGRDLLVVEQGGTLGQVPPFGTQPNSDLVDVGAVGRTGEVFPTPTGGEVRVLIPPGRYVRVFGTLPVDDILVVARSLTSIEGKGLRYLSVG